MEPRHGRSTPTRVVVLGASGFVGKDLVEHLLAEKVDTLGLSSRDMDLRDPKCVHSLSQIIRPCDCLVFVSALTPDKGKDIATLMANLRMAEHVASALEESPCAHMLYVSSDAVYEDDANPVRENSPCTATSFHGVMHYTRERMLVHSAQKAQIPLSILRPTLLYGAMDTHHGYGPNRFLRTAQTTGKITLFGQGEEKRDHVHIRDVSRLIHRCVNDRHEGVLNIATGTSTSFFDVAQMVARQCQSSVHIECLPRANPITHRHFDISALRKAFPAFQFTRMQEGIVQSMPAVTSREAA